MTKEAKRAAKAEKKLKVSVLLFVRMENGFYKIETAGQVWLSAVRNECHPTRL